MLSAYKYGIYPNSGQEMQLKRSLLSLCSLYNRLRARKIEDYGQSRRSLNQTDLRAIALQERRVDPELQSIHGQVVQNCLTLLQEHNVVVLEITPARQLWVLPKPCEVLIPVAVLGEVGCGKSSALALEAWCCWRLLFLVK
jgi:transposase